MLLVANIQVLLILWICSAIAVDAQSGTVAESINPAATNVTLAQSSAPAVASTLAGTVGNGVVSQPSLLDQIDQAIVQAVADTKNALQKILAPELYYSYGRSPPVYPSRKSCIVSALSISNLTFLQQMVLVRVAGPRHMLRQRLLYLE